LNEHAEKSGRAKNAGLKMESLLPPEGKSQRKRFEEENDELKK
jgi:hypothetical protein